MQQVESKLKKTAKFREDLPLLYSKIKQKLISVSQAAKEYNISHTIAGQIIREYEKDLENSEIDLQHSATNLQQFAISHTKKDALIVKEKAKFEAIREIIKEQLESYNMDRHCKKGSKVITNNKSDYISKTVALRYPEAKNLDRLDIRALVR